MPLSSSFFHSQRCTSSKVLETWRGIETFLARGGGVIGPQGISTAPGSCWTTLCRSNHSPGLPRGRGSISHRQWDCRVVPFSAATAPIASKRPRKDRRVEVRSRAVQLPNRTHFGTGKNRARRQLWRRIRRCGLTRRDAKAGPARISSSPIAAKKPGMSPGGEFPPF